MRKMRKRKHPVVVPTILAGSERVFRERLRAIEAVAPLVHLDVMDGHFVPNRAWANPRVIARMRTRTSFAVHLMVAHPMRRVAEWTVLPRVEEVIIHAESHDPARALDVIRRAGKRAGVAINPTTPIAALDALLDFKMPYILVMANEPGFSSHPFLPEMLLRIRTLRKRYPSATIGVDIGINAHTLPDVRAAGANYGAAGSAIFNADDPATAYRTLCSLIT